MGCDINCVLQKRDFKTKEWNTIDKELFDRDYQLFTFLSGVRGYSTDYDNIATQGVPEGFKIDIKEGERYHQDMFMGDHSFGWCTLETFCNAPLPEISIGDKFSVEKFHNSYTVTFNENEDDYYYIRQLQSAWRILYGDPLTVTIDSDDWHSYSIADYRLVFGYDS